MKTFFLIVSVLLFIGSLRYLLQMKKFGIFPPKKILKRRASALAIGGTGCLILAMMFAYIL